jgi:ParB family chromosome partitioning protein
LTTEPTFLRASLDDIDWNDRRFEILSFTSHQMLEESLEELGILSPPWLWAHGGKLIIVNGFKRLHLLRKSLGAHTVCIVYPADSDESNLLARRVHEKWFHGALNTAEKAQLVLKLAERFTPDHIAASFFQKLTLNGPPLEVIAKWRRLATAGEALLQAAASEAISERSALELATWPEEARARVLAVLCDLQCSASIQAEILERVTEIGKRESIGRAEVLRGPEVDAIMSADQNRRQKTQALRDLLTLRRFPRLKAREQRFIRELAEAHLPGSVRLNPPPSFEGDRWTLNISFADPAGLCTLLNGAEKFARSPVLAGIMAADPQTNGRKTMAAQDEDQ